MNKLLEAVQSVNYNCNRIFNRSCGLRESMRSGFFDMFISRIKGDKLHQMDNAESKFKGRYLDLQKKLQNKQISIIETSKSSGHIFLALDGKRIGKREIENKVEQNVDSTSLSTSLTLLPFLKNKQQSKSQFVPNNSSNNISEEPLPIYELN